jgi:protein-tyrosine phosphatase
MYRITQCLTVGPFALSERANELRAMGVTHVFNVSDTPSQLSSADGFAEVAEAPMSDSRRLSQFALAHALDTLHRLASEPDAHVYVHCVMGQLRSPTILWLYLVALGVPPDEARELIEVRAPNAVAGHYRMVDAEHVTFAQKHGQTHFAPHPRPEVFVPYPLPDSEE